MGKDTACNLGFRETRLVSRLGEGLIIMGQVCFEFWGPDESRIYSVFGVSMEASLAIRLGVLVLEESVTGSGVFGWTCLDSSGW